MSSERLRQSVVLFFLAFVVGTMPCHACYDDDSDDEYEYDDYDWDDDDDYDWYTDDDDVVYGESTEYDIDYGELPEVICNGDDLSDESDDIDWDYYDSSDEDLSIDDDIFEDDYLDISESNIGALNIDNNNEKINIPEKDGIHIPRDNEHLFKENLPAQSMKQRASMDCASTSIANLLSHKGNSDDPEVIRKTIENAYKTQYGMELKSDGIRGDYFSEFMQTLCFVNIPLSSIKEEIEAGHPSVALIETSAGLHMVEIVGYYDNIISTYSFPLVYTTEESDKESNNELIEEYQRINPSTGKYETHTATEMKKYSKYIYTAYAKELKINLEDL